MYSNDSCTFQGIYPLLNALIVRRTGPKHQLNKCNLEWSAVEETNPKQVMSHDHFLTFFHSLILYVGSHKS